MQSYILAIRDRSLSLESDDSTLVRTSRGVDELNIRFYSDEWLDDFNLSVAFSIDGITEVPITLTLVEGVEWLAECTVAVPDEVLGTEGQLGVTVHGVKPDGTHIIRARAYPLEIEREGDGIGSAPSANPS